MLENGHVKLYRSMLNWRWYRDGNTMRLFLHLILTANWEDRDFETITVHRGQRVASRRTLSEELRISEQEVKTAIKHLISTNEITSESTSKYTVFTVNNYDLYQSLTNKSTNDQPTINQRPTSDQPQLKKDKKDKKDKNNIYIAENPDFESAKSKKPDAKPYQEIVDYLNQKAGTSYRSNSKATQANIRAWLEEGYTVEDFKRVIDNKCTDWIGTQWEEYLRPSTLFGTKFENYLNRKQTKQQKQQQETVSNAELYQSLVFNIDE